MARLSEQTRTFSNTAANAVRRAIRPVDDTGSYTRFVGWMKLVLPLIASILVVLLVVWPQLGEKVDGFRLGQSGISLEKAAGQQVANALFTGTDKRNRPFTITAQSANQSATNKNAVQLNLPKADLTLKDGAWVAMSSKTGLYDRELQTLDLTGDVSMFQDGGYEFRTRSIRIFLNDNTVTGKEPVQGQGPFGMLSAAGVRLLDQGKRIMFTGKTRLTIFPGARNKSGGKAKPTGDRR